MTFARPARGSGGIARNGSRAGAVSVYELRNNDEGRKQLYWGAFMQGCVAFHRHRRAGYWVNSTSVDRLADSRFAALYGATVSDGGSLVDDYNLGLQCFTEGFQAGYEQRAQRLTVDGLTLRGTPTE